MLPRRGSTTTLEVFHRGISRGLALVAALYATAATLIILLAPALAASLPAPRMKLTMAMALAVVAWVVLVTGRTPGDGGRILRRVAGAGAGTFGLVILGSYLGGIGGWENIPSPQAAGGIALGGLALLAGTGDGTRQRGIADGGAVGMAMAGALGIVGRATGTGDLFEIPGSTSLPLDAALLLVAIGLALLLADPSRGLARRLSSRSSGATVLRTAVPSALAALMAGGAVREGLITWVGLDARSADWFLVTFFLLAGLAYTAWMAQVLDRREAETVATAAEYRAMFDAAHEGIIHSTLDGTLVSANLAAAHLLGYEDVEALIHTLPSMRAIYANPPDRDAIVAEVLAAGATSKEVTVLRRDGSTFPALLSLAAVRDDDGVPQGMRGMVCDRSGELRAEQEREQAVASLKESAEHQHRLAALSRAALTTSFEDLPHLITATLQTLIPGAALEILHQSADGRVVLMAGVGWDRRAELLEHGAHLRDCARHLLGNDDSTTILINDWLKAAPFPMPAFLTRHGIRTTLCVPIEARGTTGAFLMAHRREVGSFTGEEIDLAEAAASILGAVARSHRVTEELRTTERTLQGLLDNAPAAIYIADPAGRVLLANDELGRIMGSSPRDLVGLTRGEMPLTADQAAAHDAADQRVLAARKPITVEELAFVDGVEHTFLSVKFPLLAPDGTPTGVGGISTDITDLRVATEAAERAWSSTLQRLAQAVEYRDEETGAHVQRMAAYCELIARDAGLPDDLCHRIHVAAVLHDAGKVGIPDRILLKDGPLTDEERAVMQTHAEIGHRLLKGSGNPVLDLAASIAWAHHEKLDGTGYPRGLAGDAIPVEGRIAAVSDVFDALTSDRPYRPAMELERVVAIMTEGRGTHFDPVFLDILLAHVTEAMAIRSAYKDEAWTQSPTPAPA